MSLSGDNQAAQVAGRLPWGEAIRRTRNGAVELSCNWRDPLVWPRWWLAVSALLPSLIVLVTGTALIVAWQFPVWKMSHSAAQHAARQKAAQQRSYRHYLDLKRAQAIPAQPFYPAVNVPARPLDTLAERAREQAVQVREAEIFGAGLNRYLNLVMEGELPALLQLLLAPGQLGTWYAPSYSLAVLPNGRFMLSMVVRWDLSAVATALERDVLVANAATQAERLERLTSQLSGRVTTPHSSEAPAAATRRGLAAEPLHDLRFRGSWRGASGAFALLESSSGHVYRVQPGEIIGLEAAQVTDVSARGVVMTLRAAGQPPEQLRLTPDVQEEARP